MLYNAKTKLLNITLKPFIFHTITFDSTVIIISDCDKSLSNIRFKIIIYSVRHFAM